MELSLYPILHPGSDHVAEHTAHVWAHTKSASQRVVGGRFVGGSSDNEDRGSLSPDRLNVLAARFQIGNLATMSYSNTSLVLSLGFLCH